MTLALRSRQHGAVLGLDTSVEGLSTTIGALSLPPGSEVVIVYDQATVLAANPARLPRDVSRTALPTLSHLGEVFALLDAKVRQVDRAQFRGLSLRAEDDRLWLASLAPLGAGPPFQIALVVAVDTLKQEARKAALRELAWTAVGLLVLLPIIWLVSRRTAAPLLALTRLLTQAACEQQVGPFAEFNLNDEQWEAMHIASWLHDCGKITTPEFVVDKATKLETLYDRIHEVRTRFEVLKRDAHIEMLAARLSAADQAACLAEVAPTWRVLDEEFAFVARCNLGEEEMATEKQVRLAAMAERTWWRTLDDHLGISRGALALRAETPVEPLPCRETLLADKPYHRVPRPAQERLDEGNPWGFKVNVPEWLYDRGERYNLSIRRGTLTEEERYKINEHIIQTIRMLECLRFPRHLRGVPEIAGGHHKRVDGKGYPRRLCGSHMSVPARIMAIADVFEALTASDRPYKPPKTVSQSLSILCTMACDGHIDVALFRLFVTARIWETYAARLDMQAGFIRVLFEVAGVFDCSAQSVAAEVV